MKKWLWVAGAVIAAAVAWFASGEKYPPRTLISNQQSYTCVICSSYPAWCTASLKAQCAYEASNPGGSGVAGSGGFGGFGGVGGVGGGASGAGAGGTGGTGGSCSSSTTYLSDLTPLSGSVNGSGAIGFDVNQNGGPIVIGGVTHAKGLATRVDSAIAFTVPATCSTFSTTIGIDDAVGDSGNGKFEIWRNGSQVYISPSITGAQAGVDVSATFAAGDQLLLRTNSGSIWAAGYTDWGSARLACTSCAGSGGSGGAGSGGTGGTGGSEPPPSGEDYHPAEYSVLYAPASDEFNGGYANTLGTTGLNKDKWCTRFHWNGDAVDDIPSSMTNHANCYLYGGGRGQRVNNEQGMYVELAKNGANVHEVSNGTLKLKAYKTRSDPGWNWLFWDTAMIRTPMNVLLTPPLYTAVRVKLPQTRGTFPAFWIASNMFPDGSVDWPPEIDWFEGPLVNLQGHGEADNGDSEVWGSIHLNGTVVQGAQTTTGQRVVNYKDANYDVTYTLYRPPVFDRSQWHVIGCEWLVDRSKCWLDGFLVADMQYRWKANSGTAHDGSPWARGATLILNLAMGGSWAGRKGVQDVMPAPHVIEWDWVRTYVKPGYPQPWP